MAKGAQQQDGQGGDDDAIDFSGEEGALLGEDGAESQDAGGAQGDGAAAVGGKKPGAADDDDGGKGAGAMVPSHRLREVSEHNSELERENAFLKGQLTAQQQRDQAAAAQKVADTAPKVDLDALEDKLYEANQTGNREEAIRISRTIREEMKRQAKEEATAEATSVAEARIAEREEARERAELRDVADQIASQYPGLDSNNPDTKDQTLIDAVMGTRGRLEREGVRSPVALARAVREVAAKFGITKEGGKAAANPGQVRNQQALARAGETSRRQPERTPGVGNRSGAAVGTNLTDAQIRGIGNTKEEKHRMFAGDIAGMEDDA